jgi:hypothetical protein
VVLAGALWCWASTADLDAICWLDVGLLCTLPATIAALLPEASRAAFSAPTKTAVMFSGIHPRLLVMNTVFSPDCLFPL